VSSSINILKISADFSRLEQQKEELDATAIKADTQAAMDTLQDLQSQFEAVCLGP